MDNNLRELMGATEKRICNLPGLRVPERLEMELRRLADMDGRLLSDYLRRVLEQHCFGHARTFVLDDGDGNNNRAAQRDAT